MPPQASDPQTKWLEIAAVIILSLASLLAAWSTFQAAQWTRQQAINSNAAVVKLLESNRESAAAGQDTLIDVVTFTSWLEAYSTGNQTLADFYRSRFRAEFKPAFEAWVALQPNKNPEAPSSPFAMDEYAPARLQLAEDLQSEAAGLQQSARSSAENSEFYVRNTLYLATALFFVGISRMFSNAKVRLVLQVLAGVLVCLGVFNIVTGSIS